MPEILNNHMEDEKEREFYFDPKVDRYRYKDSGKLAPTKAIRNLMERRIDNAKNDMEKIIDLYNDGTMNTEEMNKAVAKKLKKIHIENMLLGKGGEKFVNESDYGRTGNVLKNEYRYLKRFFNDVENNTMTQKQQKKRINMFANRGRLSYWKSKEKINKEAGKKWMRRHLSVAEHCADCISYRNAGWQPVGTLPQPTEACECTANCKCYVEYAETIQDSIQSAFDRFQSNIGFVGN